MLLAWLVLAAQLFSQLHAIEHLEDADHGEHSEEACQLCILSANLDNASDNTRTFPHAQSQTAQLAHVQRVNPTPKFVAAYQSRAPPLLSSIV
jgi:hypothetical protein